MRGFYIKLEWGAKIVNIWERVNFSEDSELT
jgi:hypothetical protein